MILTLFGNMFDVCFLEFSSTSSLEHIADQIEVLEKLFQLQAGRHIQKQGRIKDHNNKGGGTLTREV